MWTQIQALRLCRRVEEFAPLYGYHVGLTGGCLYKEGWRKDCDLIFYPHQNGEPQNLPKLFESLERNGFKLGEEHGWMRKAIYDGKPIDCFFMERTHVCSSEEGEDY